jgi:hypothetical protein
MTRVAPGLAGRFELDTQLALKSQEPVSRAEAVIVFGG